MTIKDMIKEEQITLGEVKNLFREILDTHTGQTPIKVTITYDKKRVTFDFVKRRKRRRPNGQPYAITEISYEKIQKTTVPGVYYAIDDFTIYKTKTIPFVYGLYVDRKKVRDLRFFNDLEGCTQWLEKKLSLLEK